MHEHETEQRVSCLTHLPSFCCFTILFNNPVMFLLLQYTDVGCHKRYIISSNILLQMERLQTLVFIRKAKHYQAYTNVGRHMIYKL